MLDPQRSRIPIIIGLLAAWLVVFPPPSSADVRLPRVFGDHMVVQRGIEIPVWGWADPAEEVTVQLGKRKAKTRADAEGKWMARLGRIRKAGGPYEMTVTGKNAVRFTDVLVGEVWIASGQSNMQWSVRGAADPEKEIPAAQYPDVRLLQAPRVAAGQPTSDIEVEWKRCSPETIADFSAVAYFFGRKIHEDLKVPVGLIDASWGGTRIEPWTPPAGFASVPELSDQVKKIEGENAKYRQAVAESLKPIENWIQEAQKALAGNAPIPPIPAFPQHGLNGSGAPTGLYNGMVHPFAPFGIRGAIWYQGEANRNDGLAYHEKMKALINGWRAVWGQGDFPFYYVQLAPFRYQEDPRESAKIWEAQSKTLSVPNTGMAVTVDIGNVADIHPKNKQDVGKRLALWALAKDYGRKGLVYSGPLYKSMTVEGRKVRIRFDHVGGGLVSRDGKPLTWFEVAERNGRFEKAEASIDGKTVLVWSDKAPSPVAVRFAWNIQAEPNLSNKEGLPAPAFRTDDW
jgi:sialate O-acetylesterase